MYATKLTCNLQVYGRCLYFVDQYMKHPVLWLFRDRRANIWNQLVLREVKEGPKPELLPHDFSLHPVPIHSFIWNDHFTSVTLVFS